MLSLCSCLVVILCVYWGMLLVYVGIGVFIFGVMMVKSYESVVDVCMVLGDMI